MQHLVLCYFLWDRYVLNTLPYRQAGHSAKSEDNPKCATIFYATLFLNIISCAKLGQIGVKQNFNPIYHKDIILDYCYSHSIVPTGFGVIS